MIISAALPYNARYHKNAGTHLWFFYKQICDFVEKQIPVTFIGWEGNFVLPDNIPDTAWEKNAEVMAKMEYYIPEKTAFSKVDIIHVDPKIFLPLEAELKSNNLVWAYLIANEYEPLMNFYRNCFNAILKREKIEAIVVNCNLPSVDAVAGDLGVPVIHTEIGPTRKPQYLQTAYWDLSGVNGNTEAARRFADAKDELKTTLLSRSELQMLFMENSALEIAKNKYSLKYPVGVAGQVDDDSNIIAYSRGFDNLELWKYAKFHFGEDNVLFRPHPGAQTFFTSLVDRSFSPIEFLQRVENLITINSSMALEASLLGKNVMVMGDSPFQLLSDDLTTGAGNNHLEELNFLMLNYIIPYEFMFDINYYKWRLTFPSETEIRKHHLDFYLHKKGVSSLRELSAKASAVSEKKLSVNGEIKTVRISAGDIPYIIENEIHLKEYVEKCRTEIGELADAVKYNQTEAGHYKKLSEYQQSEAEHYKKLSEYHQSETEHYKKLWEHQSQETAVFKQAYEYNESEAKRLAEQLGQETQKYQDVIAQLQQQIEMLNQQLSEKTIQ